MNTLILDALFVYEDLPVLVDGKNALEIIFEKEKQCNTFERIILLQNGRVTSVPVGIKNVVVTDFRVVSILNIIVKEARNSECIMVYNGASPFYDTAFIHKMLKKHTDYLADYTYTVGYPEGLIPTITSFSCLRGLCDLVKEEEEIKQDYLFFSLSKDINAFDIETFISPIDLRMQRGKIGHMDIGESQILRRLVAELGTSASYDEITTFLSENPQALFSTIYNVFFDITSYNSTSPLYLPENSGKDSVAVNCIEELMEELYEINPNMKIIFGPKGEPFLHPKFEKIIRFFYEKGFEVIVETFGSNLSNSFLEEIDAFDKEKIRFIFKIDAAEERTYSIVHGTGNYEEVEKNYNLLRSRGFWVYKQFTRMQENESDIETIMRKKEKLPFIIKKYSTYCDQLPDRKVVDLSPIKRFNCYHLRRELYITPDLSVHFCVYSDKSIGNLKQESLRSLWEKQRVNYDHHCSGIFEEDCCHCDDYYTFNF